MFLKYALTIGRTYTQVEHFYRHYNDVMVNAALDLRGVLLGVDDIGRDSVDRLLPSGCGLGGDPLVLLPSD